MIIKYIRKLCATTDFSNVFALLNYILYLCMSVGTPICFDDCLGYIVLMGQDLPEEYLQTWLSMWRAWVVPVFFSMFGKYSLSSALSIVIVQSSILFLSWVIFAKIIANLFVGMVRIIVFNIVLLSVYAQQYFVLNRFLLSDSLSLSSVLVFLSMVIRFGEQNNITSRLLLIVSALLAVGSRDSNILIVIMGFVYLLADNLKKADCGEIKFLVIVVFVVLANQVYHASYRHQLNMRNIIAGFVLPNPDVRDFFKLHGVVDAQKDYSNLKSQQWCSASYPDILQNSRASNFPEERLDIASKWWMVWLVTHPMYVLEQAFKDRECILGQSFAKSLPWQGAKVKTSDIVFARPGDKVVTIQQGVITIAIQDFFSTDVKILSSFGLSIFLLSVYNRVSRRFIIPSIMIMCVGLCAAVSSYNADLWEPSEMLRHALIGSIVFNVGFLLNHDFNFP